MNKTLQLQLWDAKRRVYAPVPNDTPRGNAWRLCKPDRPVKNPKHVPPRHTASAYSVNDVQQRYLKWAGEKRLPSVTCYANRLPQLSRHFLGAFVYVDAYQYFTVEIDHA